MIILIAEKNPNIRSLITTRLSVRDYKIVEVTESEEVLRALEREKVDLVLLATNLERIGSKYLIEKIREKPPLANLPIILMAEENEIAELVMSQDRGFDDFLVKPFNSLVLQLRVGLNISRARHRVEANALTGLPGNQSIERVVRTKIEKNEKFSVIYIDINHFKSFNDQYGFEKGDDVIKHTAKILLQTAENLGESSGAFVGHIGGDDFVVVTRPEQEEAFARAFIGEFDRIMPSYYNEADRKRGTVRVTNRQGKRETFPLMSCSVAACTNLYFTYKNLGEIARDVAEVKTYLKSQPGSHYLRDRRSAPVRELKEALEILAPEVEKKKEAEGYEPLGRVLLNAGLITGEQLDQALKRHLESGQRLGQVLINMNAVRSEDVGRMLEKKLDVPYVSLKRFEPKRELLRIFTFDFMRSHRVVALEVVAKTVKLGMCDPFDLRTLDSIERITGLKPVPCLTLEDEFEEFLESHEQKFSREEKIG